jgi:glycosyltransferase involved in cell wall biosynthesis
MVQPLSELSGTGVMPEERLVSIVIPVRNGERFVVPTLESALAQTYDPIEVLVVDDGSTDRTAVLLEAAAARDKRIRLFRVERSGVAAARNLAISRARGELIAPLDADDLWHPEKIARQVAMMRAAPPAVGLVYCWSIEVDENDFVVSRIGSKSTAQGRVTEELAKGNFLENSSSPLIRRSCLDAVGGYDPSLQPHGAEDWKLYLALSEICEFAVIPEYLVGYRQSNGSLSRDVAAMAKSTELVECWLIEKWPNLPEELRRQRRYYSSVYLARLALDNNKFVESLRYLARGYRARPAGLLERSSFEFGARFLARIAGFRRAVLRQYGLKTSVTFKEFQATRQV